MNTADAAVLLHELLETEVEVVKQVNTPRGLSKKLETREQKLIVRVFEAMTGFKPSGDEMAVINTAEGSRAVRL